MANTYSQLYIQIVFVVKGRENLLLEKHREEIQKYMTGIIQNRKHKLLAIYAMPDHVHIFIGYNPSQPLPDLVRDIKANTSSFIKEKKMVKGYFSWQEGYGAFSYSGSAIDNVVRYINNQAEHHRKRKFKEEYLELLKIFEIEYKEEYLFDWGE